MKSSSRLQIQIPGYIWRRLAGAGALVVLSVVLGACISATKQKHSQPAKERHLKFEHALHVDGLDCTTCHEPDPEREGRFSLPGHDICSVCHEIGEDQPEPDTCRMCHVGEQLSFDRTSILHTDLKFTHDPHVAALECAACHEDPDTKPLPKLPLKPFCMDCHADTRPALNECSVCHIEIDRDYVPTMRGNTRIPHDAPEIWEHVHGRESRVNPMYCAMCHDEQESCQSCHDRVAPKDHTLTWRRKSHGLHATWERNRCAACHEEEFCVKCHQNTTPSSHRGGWGSPVNRHCVSCHFPENQTSCLVCHESIDHRSAKPSPHNFGLFPANCAQCHPGGLPFRAPHALNSSVRCIVCHK